MLNLKTDFKLKAVIIFWDDCFFGALLYFLTWRGYFRNYCLTQAEWCPSPSEWAETHAEWSQRLWEWAKKQVERAEN